MVSKTLEKARLFEKENLHKADAFRPVFHVTGGIGWINDPNGFSVYKGEYHLFHQYHPYSTEWGPMHWGHLKSKDFIKWERLPIALAPDSAFDKDGCFSGNAIEIADDKHLLIYTGVVKNTDSDGVFHEYRHQCIAIGDGENYEKLAENPVIDAKDIPDGGSISDFRDPKIWKEGDDFYALVGNRAGDGSGSLPLYTSKDAIHWTFVKVLDCCRHEYGTMWECPDFFSLENKQFLVVSPMDMEAQGLEFHSGHGVVAFCGDYDKNTHNFKREWAQAVDYGTDFYAPQTLIAPDGRRIMIGWMRNWATTGLRPANAPIFGAMTLPRELSLKNDRLYINPVRELENYRCSRTLHENVHIQSATRLEGISGRVFDMTVTVTPESTQGYAFFKIALGKGAGHEASIIYRPKENSLCIDRTLASMRLETVQSRNIKVSDRKGEIKLRIIMDCDSIELFINDGESVASFITYNPLEEDAIEFSADTAVKMTVDKYDINVNQES